MLKVEAIGDGTAQRRPLCRLVAQPQTANVFQWCLRCLSHLNGDHGDDVLRKTVPSTVDINCDVPSLSKDNQSQPGSLRGVITDVITHNTSHTRIKHMKFFKR
jgi:hypothetical protein